MQAVSATKITNTRWMCPICSYAYLTAGMGKCPNCDGYICNDSQDVLNYYSYQATFQSKKSATNVLGEFPGFESKYKPKYPNNQIQLDLRKMLAPVAFKYIELNAEKVENMTLNNLNKPKQQVYSIRIESPFILTQRQIKEKLGIGFKIVSVETEKDLSTKPIIDVDSAVAALIQTGYRALARANHPDLSASDETESEDVKRERSERMMLINRAKKEINELLDSLR